MIQKSMPNNAGQKPNQVSVVLNIWGKDNEDCLRRSLESVRRQIQKPDEVIIVIDGPINEDLHKIVQSYEMSLSLPINRIDLPIASGLWNARNVGIHAAKYEFIAVHDADDIMHPDRLRIQLDQISNAEIDVLGSPVYEFDANNERVCGLRSLASSDQLPSKMLWQNVINHSSVMLRKSAVVGVGGYRNVHLAEDYDLWLRLISAGKKLSSTDVVLQAFSVDDEIDKRRGGLRFISSEIALHRQVRSTKELNLLTSWIRFLLRLVFRLGPGFLRKSYRSSFQAKKSQNSPRDLAEFLNNPPRNINLIA